MPNHVTCELSIMCPSPDGVHEPRELERLKEFIRSDETDEQGNRLPISFEKIEPTPAYLLTDTSQMTEEELETFYQNCVSRFGTRDWYDWRVQHWGTKWDAYNQLEENPGLISFQTAWSPPIGAVLSLSHKFPHAAFTLSYADENVGYNVGNVNIKAGEITYHYTPREGTEEAERMSCHIMGLDYDEFIDERHENDYEYDYDDDEQDPEEIATRAEAFYDAMRETRAELGLAAETDLEICDKCGADEVWDNEINGFRCDCCGGSKK